MPLDTPRVTFHPGDDIASLVGRHARESPDRIALIQESRHVPWAELDSRVGAVSRALANSGIRPGDRVAVLSGNSIDYVEVFFGGLRAGACVVPLPTMGSPESLALMLEDCGARALIASSPYAGVADAIAGGRDLLRVSLDSEAPGWTAYDAWLASAPPGARDVPIGPDDAFDVIYSSGTTGVPKGIVHGHGARKASYAGSRSRYFSSASVNVVATPFYSNTTCITWLLTTAAGGTNVILGRFTPEGFLKATERNRATHAMLVPVQYDRLLACDRFGTSDVSSLTHLFSTSSPLRAETKRRILDVTRAELVEIYGLTEGGPVTVLEGRQHPDKLASVGKPATGCELRIVDEAGQDVPPGQAGEIVGRSANMTSGYLNRPDDTSAMLFRDAAGVLYFKSGDIGRLDEDGFLYLLDRKKDVIISGGFNVYATDLEAVLAAHPDVAEVAVIGVPSERWGETPLALVVRKPGSEVSAEVLREHCNERVGKAQRVSAVELRDELPKSPIGKVLKRELREPYWKT